MADLTFYCEGCKERLPNHLKMSCKEICRFCNIDKGIESLKKLVRKVIR